jgi:four helix bundle protein
VDEMLRIHETALALVREVAPVAAAIARQDVDLARQLRRALSSVTLNIAEGSDQRGARRASHYSVALGSAREAWSAVRTAVAWGYVDEPSLELADRFDHVCATLYVNARR